MQCFLHVHAHPYSLLQVKDITRSLKEREARVTEAEGVAASHLQREKRLIQLESSVLEREQALERQLADAAAGRAELESQQARQRQEAVRLEDAVRSLSRDREEAAARLGEREAALAAREQDLAAAMQRFGEERQRQAAADEQQRQQTVAELQRLDAGISEAMGQLRQAEEEADAMRRRVGEVQREAGEAEAARDKALQAHKAAQQAAQGAQAAMDAALATGNEELAKVREGRAGWSRVWHWYCWALAVLRAVFCWTWVVLLLPRPAAVLAAAI
jgi:chromosome segregation ATPase